ncbi:hypothetical protein [Stenotrophomonas maltophilia]|uniref:hypothetical protein n=1 Tax=Stenotrophomonas maltophilia TaxID=40324 RepID=UPI0012996DAD|nr:hypothetical protein [Stenotrophomonas maltophilia]BBO51711.1 hypothetical protein KMM349_20420 [Stenotrophomonas maltophilia]
MDAKDQASISRWDAGIACAISLGLGGVLMAVVLIGSDIPLKCIEGGNAADWLAAAGAWVIGLAAAYYTRQSHVHRVEEAEREAERVRRKSIALLTATFGATIKIVGLEGMVRRFKETIEGDRPKAWQFENLMNLMDPSIGDIVLPDDTMALLDTDAVTKLALINGTLGTLRQYIWRGRKFFDGYAESMRGPVDDPDAALVNELYRGVEEVMENRTAFAELVGNVIQNLRQPPIK